MGTAFPMRGAAISSFRQIDSQFLGLVGIRLIALKTEADVITDRYGRAPRILVMMSSVGARALGGTAPLLPYPHLPIAIIVGSETAQAVPLTLVAGIGHWILGSVDWRC
jgi:hypothetical protein